MADKDHLRILREGVEVWNKWQRRNRNICADFTKANLAGANLAGINLREATLSLVNLSNANLVGANLRASVLVGANLIGANLVGANLAGSVLINAVLKGSNLRGADLRGCDLSNADLSNVDLSSANLSATHALGSDFTKATLTGACIAYWITSNGTKLAEIDCEYIFLMQVWANRKWLYDDRRPSDPNQNFAPGEFTKLFQKALSTVDLIFRNGVDWDALLISLEKLKIEAEGAELSIQAIENKNDGAFVVRVNVPPEANKAEVEKFLKREYDSALKILDEKYQYQLNAKGVEIESYRRENANLMEIARLMASRPINVEAKAIAESQTMGDTFNNDFQGANIANFANKLEGNARQQAIINNFSPEQKQNLAEAAAEIQQLLNQLAQTNPTSESAIVEAVHQEIKRNPTLKARLLGALKAGGLEALKAIFAHPVFTISAESVKGWLEAE